jgi:hypothetical protein
VCRRTGGAYQPQVEHGLVLEWLPDGRCLIPIVVEIGKLNEIIRLQLRRRHFVPMIGKKKYVGVYPDNSCVFCGKPLHNKVEKTLLMP